MPKFSWLLTTMLLASAATSQAQMQIRPDTSIVFASADEGKKILAQRDEFVAALSPFDRSARLKTDRAVGEKEYLEFVAKNVLDWSDADKRKVEAAIQAIKPRLDELSLPFPKSITLIETSGDEEGGAAYTRDKAIVLPKRDLAHQPEALQGILAHELFHVLSRANPQLREPLYAMIGFRRCQDVELPTALKTRKITNPDAPLNDHCIQLQVDDKATWAIPILVSKSEKYDVARGGQFFDYLQLKFLLVERDDDAKTVKVILRDAAPALVDMENISRFLEQVGKNTDYVLHPEEILAENFKLLVLGTKKLPSPEIQVKMREILALQKARRPRPVPDGGKSNRG